MSKAVKISKPEEKHLTVSRQFQVMPGIKILSIQGNEWQGKSFQNE